MSFGDLITDVPWIKNTYKQSYKYNCSFFWWPDSVFFLYFGELPCTPVNFVIYHFVSSMKCVHVNSYLKITWLMGMLIGASWISIGELLIFYIGFFALLLKFFCSKYVCKSQNLMNSQLSVNSEISNDL